MFGELTVELTDEIVHATYVERRLTVTATGQPVSVSERRATKAKKVNIMTFLNQAPSPHCKPPALQGCTAGIHRLA